VDHFLVEAGDEAIAVDLPGDVETAGTPVTLASTDSSYTRVTPPRLSWTSAS
jgi:hypothetical protein